MNATDVLKYGDRTFRQSLQPVPRDQWNAPGVCGVWSVKNLVAHLASYEIVLVDVLSACLRDVPTPHLDEMLQLGDRFNDELVNRKAELSDEETLAEYEAAHASVMQLVAEVPAEQLRKPGTLPWYGAPYAIDDYLVYAFYGHKREHSAQIAVFCDRLAAMQASAS